MATLRIEGTCTVPKLAAALQTGGLLGTRPDAVVVMVGPGAFVDLGTMAWLTAWALRAHAEGVRLLFRGDEQVLRFAHPLHRHDPHPRGDGQRGHRAAPSKRGR